MFAFLRYQAVCAPVPNTPNNTLQLAGTLGVAEDRFGECGDELLAALQASPVPQSLEAMAPSNQEEALEEAPGRDEFSSTLTNFAINRG